MTTARPRYRLAVALAIVWIAAISLPFTACWEGPYANVAPEIRDMVIAQVQENHSALQIWRSNLGRALSQFLPVILLALLLIPGALFRRSRSHRIILAFLLLGMIGSFIQLRLLIWAVALLPVAFGVVLSDLINRPWPGFRLLKPFVILPLTLLILIPPLGLWLLSLALGDRFQMPAATGQMDQACNTRPQLQTLNEIAPAFMLTPLNLGAPVLYNTHHSVTSVPYHRSPTALISGVAPFQGDAENLLSDMDRLGADHVLLCRGQRYWGTDSAATQLAAGQDIEGLQDVEIPESNFRLLRRN